MAMSTGSWSELGAEHEVRYNGKGSFFVTTMSKTSKVVVGLYVLVVGGVRSQDLTGVLVCVIT